ncbi:uncharacterized protein LOC141595680 [Silene latifolia]|uniref:uncharacterized protein LOC141595680 n=1 Tax=Silene latifolia TaxID=37657 RepID=UPI003D7818B0
MCIFQDSIGEKEHDIQNKCPNRLVPCAPSCGLPDDLVFTILLLIPAKLLHENMRFISRFWRQTITSPCFITNHLQISSAHHTHGLLVDFPCHQNNVAFYIKPPTSGDANPEFRVTELAKPPFDCRIRGSYHGLVLLQHEVNRDQFHVANLVTKSIVSLPSFPKFANLSTENYEFSWTGIAFSYSSSINRYKVVIATHPYIKHLKQSQTPPQVWVYTVGVDQNWRKLEVPAGIDKFSLWCALNPVQIPFHSPRSVGGFVYWSGISYPYAYGVALDVDTELFQRFILAPTTKRGILNYYWIICLQTGLGVVITYKGGNLWRLYELTDLKSSKWTKIVDIDARAILNQIKNYLQSTGLPSVTPIVYTNDEKLWFLSSPSSANLFYYNMREELIVPVPLNGKDIAAYHHVNTLLTLKNC